MGRILLALFLFLTTWVGLVPEVVGWGPDARWATAVLLAIWLGPLAWESWLRLRQRDPYARPLPAWSDLAVYGLLVTLALATAYLGWGNSAQYARYRRQALGYLEGLRTFQQACLAQDRPRAEQAHRLCEEHFGLTELAGAALSGVRQTASATWLWDAHGQSPGLLRHLAAFDRLDRFDEDLELAGRTLRSPLGSADWTTGRDWSHRSRSRWAP